jgi:hypothetical protein
MFFREEGRPIFHIGGLSKPNQRKNNGALGFVKSSIANAASEIFTKTRFAGVFSGGATPDPIPNSEVKPASGDGSAVVTLWESSTMPAFF